MNATKPDVERRQMIGFNVTVLGATEDQVSAVARYIYDHGIATVAREAAENVHLRPEQVLPVPVSEFRNRDTIWRLREGQQVQHRMSGWTGEVAHDVERDDEEFQGGKVNVLIKGDRNPITITIDELEVPRDG